MANEPTHSMDLNDYARLAGLREYLPHEGGLPIIITPALAEALDRLIDAAEDEAPMSGLLIDALDEVKLLHDYTAVRLGGRPV